MLQQRPVCQHTNFFLVLFSSVFSTLSLTNHLNRQTFALMHDSSAPELQWIVIITFEENATTDEKLLLNTPANSFLSLTAVSVCACGIMTHVVFFFSLFLCLRVHLLKYQEYKDSVIRGSWRSFFCGVTLHDGCLTHFQRGFKISCYLAIFLCHYNSKRMLTSYITTGSCKSSPLMESVNKRWVQHPADITATFMHMNKLHALSGRIMYNNSHLF